MKKHISLLACFLTSAVLAAAETIVHYSAENGLDLNGRVTLSNDAASGKKAYCAAKTEISSKNFFEIDPDYTYTISLKFKNADSKPAWIHIGVHPFDNNDRPISESSVNHREGTITRLLEPAKKGDKAIYVANCTKWRKSPGNVAAFFAEHDLSDIPTRNISGNISSIEPDTVRGCKINFKTPLPFDIPAGTLVRQHGASGPYHYFYSTSIKNGKWQTWTSKPLSAADMRMASKVRLMIVANAHPTATGKLVIDDIIIKRTKKTPAAKSEKTALPEGTEVWHDAENGIDLNGRMTLSNNAASGEKAYLSKKGEIISRKVVEVIPGYKYRISAKFKPANNKNCFVHMGVLPLDETGTPIAVIHSIVVKNSLTQVVKNAEKGDKSISVKSAAAWKKSGISVAAFSAKEDLSDLPNRINSGYIESIKKETDCDIITFKKPLAFDVPSGTSVRQHSSGGPYHYLRVISVKPGDWIKLESPFFTSKNIRYAAKFRVIIVVNTHPSAKDGELLIDEIKVEKIKDTNFKDNAMSKNILKDPDFAESNVGKFGYWSIGMRDAKLTKLRGGGIHGMDAVKVKFNSATEISHCGISILPGCPYRIGGYVRTKNFKAKRSGFTLHDSGRYWIFRTDNFPENTYGKWVKVEKIIPGPAGVFTRWVKSCMFDIEAIESSGELEICTPFMIPMTAEGEKNTSVLPPAINTCKRIFPLFPVLNKIRAAKPEIKFAVYYPIDNKEINNYECEITFAGQTRKLPLDKQQNVTAEFAPVQPGKYEFICKLFRKNDQKILQTNSYPCTAVIDRIPEKAKKLNNLVSELGKYPLENRKYDFDLSTDRWVWIGLDKADKNTKVFLDNGKEPVIYYRDGEQSETMRYLTAGKHQLHVSGANSGNNLTIRLVKQLILFPLNIWAKEHADHRLHKFGMDFFKKHFMSNFNTFHIMAEVEMGLPYFKGIEKNLDSFAKERGKRLITSGSSMWDDPKALNEDVRTGKGIEKYHGRALDEIGTWWAFERQMSVSEGLWNLIDFDKSVYLWMAKTRGHLFYPMIHKPLLSAASNAGGGLGKMYMETYIINQPTEDALKKYMMCLNDHITYAELSLPDAKERMVFMMSGYTSQGAWCTSVYPDGDMKYATDYFFWKFANDPQLEGIFGLGYYDFRHSDEELVRWTAALIRHYCIEGNKDMLSKKYGFTNTPGLLKNGDFNDQLEHWKLEPAEDGSLTHWNLRGFGGNAWQLRQREEGSHGDNAIQFIRSAKAPNKLSQVAKGLVPGKKYALLFVSADADDAKNRVCQDRQFQLNVNFDGAKIVPEQSNEYRLPRTIPADPKGKRCQFVNHKIVFIATKPEVKVTFSDWKNDNNPGAEIGQKRVVNYISMLPFFDVRK